VRAALLVALLAAGGAPDASPYAPAARVAYLGEALAAVRGLGGDGRHALEDALYTGARTRCRADRTRPTMDCLLDLARATCAGDAACARAADVVLVAITSENDLVDEATRARLVATAADYRVAMRGELAVRRAALAADFVLAAPGDDAELAARIDRFCSRRERDPAWQRCAAALIWYIGSEGQP
jgi:hypothetical protein